MARTDNIEVYLLFVTIEFHIHASDSLKTKRMIVKSLVDRIRNRYNASVAEIAYQNKWQRAVIGVSMLSNDRRLLEKYCVGMERLAREYSEIDLLEVSMEWL